MGTDITFAVERRGGDGVWARVENLLEDKYSETDALVREPWYDVRNYECFFLLAGIQPSARRVSPPEAVISQPRGLPDDVAEETLDHHRQFGDDAFGSSWLSAWDLITYDWWQPVENSYCAFPRCGEVEPLVPGFDKPASSLSHDDVREWVAVWGSPPPGWCRAGDARGGVDVVAPTSPDRLAREFLPVVARIACAGTREPSCGPLRVLVRSLGWRIELGSGAATETRPLHFRVR